MNDQRYNLRGVSASKEDVHNAIKNIDKGIFPKAFCKIIPDILGGDPEYCNIMHAEQIVYVHDEGILRYASPYTEVASFLPIHVS